jgi:hypothetical protein
VGQHVERRAKRFQVGVILLGLAFVPWFAWIFWLGRNDPSTDPTAHHQWLMRNLISFAAGALIAATALILLPFGRGWKRVLCISAGTCLLLFYVATVLIGD